MSKKLFPRRWVGAVGAALTLAGAAVVFVVLFLPTAASARSSDACPSAMPSIIGFRLATNKDSPGGGWKGYLRISVSHASSVVEVWFTRVKGRDHWFDSPHIERYADLNVVYAFIPSEAGKGPIRVNGTSDPNFCFVQSSKTFTPGA